MSWKKGELAHMSAEEARKELLQREAAELALRDRCRCKNGVKVRKYLNAWLCLCGRMMI